MHRVSREVRELVDDVAIPRPGEYDLEDVVINVALSVGGDASGDELGGVCGGVEGIDVLQDYAGQLVELIQASSGAGDIEIGLSQGGRGGRDPFGKLRAGFSTAHAGSLRSSACSAQDDRVAVCLVLILLLSEWQAVRL